MPTEAAKSSDEPIGASHSNREHFVECKALSDGEMMLMPLLSPKALRRSVRLAPGRRLHIQFQRRQTGADRPAGVFFAEADVRCRDAAPRRQIEIAEPRRLAGAAGLFFLLAAASLPPALS